jgi:hypothetical protein
MTVYPLSLRLGLLQVIALLSSLGERTAGQMLSHDSRARSSVLYFCGVHRTRLRSNRAIPRTRHADTVYLQVYREPPSRPRVLTNEAASVG